MTSHQLQLYLDLKEYHLLQEWFDNKDVNQLSLLEKKALVETKASLGEAHDACVLYRGLKLESLGLKAKIYYLTGDFKEALCLAKKAKDPYLTADVLIATNQFNQAIEALSGLPIHAKWYYYMGRCFGHLQDYPKAISCLEKSYAAYVQSGDEIHSVVSLANLACYLQSAGKVKKAALLFKQVEKKFSLPIWKKFPHFKARTLINWGHFQQSIGSLREATMALTQACKLLEGDQNSPDEVRAKLLLAYVYKDLGHFRRAIELLKKTEPKKEQQILDRHRYLINLYTEMGDLESAFESVRAAEKNINKKDKSGILYFNVDQSETYFMAQDFSRAEAKLQEALVVAQEIEDEVGKNYALSRWAWLNKNTETARQCRSFHLKEGLLFEAFQDSLTMAYGFIRDQKISLAEEALRECPKIESPVQEAWRFCLGAVCGSHKLHPGYEELLKGRDLPVLQLLAMRMVLLTETDLKERVRIYSDYCSLYEQLNLRKRAEFEKALNDLSIVEDKYYQVIFSNQKKIMNRFEVLGYQFSKDFFVIDLSPRSKSVHNPVQWRLLEALASQRTKSFSKEELVRAVFMKNNYHPFTDDNLIYVNVSRLKRLSPPHLPLVQCVDGKYQLSLNEKIVVIKEIPDFSSLYPVQSISVLNSALVAAPESVL